MIQNARLGYNREKFNLEAIEIRGKSKITNL
jgi:hypothetical protein